MRQWLGILILAGLFAADLSAANGPEIAITDNKLTVNADNISLSRLLRLLDSATGMQSKVPPELANRNLSVRFSGLSFDDAVKKIFQGQPYDYVVVRGHGIFVTAMSQGAGSEPAPAYTSTPQPQVMEQPFIQDIQPPQPPQVFPPVVAPQGQQPAVIQTPFGPIANPRANQPMPQPNSMPPQPPGIFGAPPAFGTPFGTQPTAVPGAVPNTPGQNPLFGNTTPIFQNPGFPNSQQPRQ
jgi:hypothetical protein